MSIGAILNKETTIDVVDEVTSGNMNPVTSNAVYNAIQSNKGFNWKTLASIENWNGYGSVGNFTIPINARALKFHTSGVITYSSGSVQVVYRIKSFNDTLHPGNVMIYAIYGNNMSTNQSFETTSIYWLYDFYASRNLIGSSFTTSDINTSNYLSKNVPLQISQGTYNGTATISIEIQYIDDNDI